MAGLVRDGSAENRGIRASDCTGGIGPAGNEADGREISVGGMIPEKMTAVPVCVGNVQVSLLDGTLRKRSLHSLPRN